MKKIGIFYGSSTGYTADLADRIARALGVDMADVHNVAETAPSRVGEYDVILLGCSTWGDGDLQADFEDFLDGLEGMWLGGKKVAIFGCGDETMSHTFGNALGDIYDRIRPTEAQVIAPFNTDGYSYDESKAIIDGKCVGLLIDETNHPDLTAAKIDAWTAEIRAAL